MVAVTFAASAVGKARTRSAFRDFRGALVSIVPGLPRASAGAVGIAVVAAEATTATLVAVPALAPLGFLVATLLLVGFTVVLASMRRRRLTTPCNCFGIGHRAVRAADIVRNALLTAVAVTGAVLTWSDGDGVTGWQPTGGGMPYLAITVGLLCMVCLLNLAMTLHIARRLAGLATAMELWSVAAPAEDRPMRVAPGKAIGAFAATTVDGAPVSSTALDRSTLVGFIAPDCPACTDTLPEFIRRAGAMPGGRNQVLAVVPGEAATAGDLRRQLAEVALVVGPDGVEPLMDAFEVTSFPAYAVLRGDTLVASHYLLSRLPETVPA